MKLEKGMYARTTKGKIFKIFDFEKVVIPYHGAKRAFEKYHPNISYHPNSIVNASFNLIELITEGDYVNGVLVWKVDLDLKRVHMGDDFYYDCETKEMINLEYVNEDDIETIVTKEQFKSLSFEPKKI